jgi:hypothetical protein
MNNDQLIQFLELLKRDVINSMQANGRFSTGKTAQQIIIVEDDDTVQLQFPDYMMALETGRAPTNTGAIPGNPPMIQRIQQWCQAKGISDKAAWAIKKSIDKKGYPGKPGILTEPLSDENINLRLDPILADMATLISEELMSQLSG